MIVVSNLVGSVRNVNRASSVKATKPNPGVSKAKAVHTISRPDIPMQG